MSKNSDNCNELKKYGNKEEKTCETEQYFVYEHENCENGKKYPNWKDVYKSITGKIENGKERNVISNSGKGIELNPGWSYTTNENNCSNIESMGAKRELFIGTYPVERYPQGDTPIKDEDLKKNMYGLSFYYEYLAPGKPGAKKVASINFGGKKSRRKTRRSKKSHRKSSKKQRKSRRGGKSRRGRR